MAHLVAMVILILGFSKLLNLVPQLMQFNNRVVSIELLKLVEMVQVRALLGKDLTKVEKQVLLVQALHL